jgi:hypothetical protein
VVVGKSRTRVCFDRVGVRQTQCTISLTNEFKMAIALFKYYVYNELPEVVVGKVERASES